jgi:hypothetical protein
MKMGGATVQSASQQRGVRVLTGLTTGGALPE